MMAKTLRWGRSILGYFFYTVAAIVIMLWVLFPVEFFQQWIPEYLAARFPHAKVALAKVEISFPGKLVLSGVEIFSSAESKDLLKIQTLELQPEVASLLSLQPVMSYTATVSEGRVAGIVRSDQSLGAFVVAGQLEHVQLDSVSGIKEILEREIQGSLNAQFRGKVQNDLILLDDLDVKVSIDNGKVGLKKDILGHGFFPFSQVSFTVTGNGEELFVERGLVESELFTADFTGKIEPRIPYAETALHFTGTMAPRTEFFAHVTDGELLSIIRTQLQNEGAVFKISGDVAHPGINFGELSSLFQSTTINAEQ